MKNKQSVIFKWLMLLFGLLAAGAFYSCSSRDTGQKAVTAQENMAFQAESAPDMAGDRTETSACAAMAEEGESEQSAESGNDMETAALSEPEVCYVYVCGEVFSPGVYIVSEGARIYEAVDLAGGFTQQAAESWLNLAEPVTDGMKRRSHQSPGEGPFLAGAAPIWQNGRERDSKRIGNQIRCIAGGGPGQHQYGISGRADDVKGNWIIQGRGHHPVPGGGRRFYEN